MKSKEPQFRKGDAVFCRVQKGGGYRWRPGTVICMDRHDERGRPLYAVWFGGLSGAFTVAEDCMQSADLDALTTV